MKRGAVICVSILAVALWARALVTPDFSGTWVLSNNKSGAPVPPFGDVQAASPQITLTVKQEGNRLHVQKVRSDGRTETADYILDGAQNTLPENILYRASWQDDKLIIDEVRKINTPFGETQVKTKIEWSLSPDGKTLTIINIAQSSMGDMQQKQVYTRQTP